MRRILTHVASFAITVAWLGLPVAVSSCGAPPLGPTSSVFSPPPPPLTPIVMHGKVHEANGGPLANVFVESSAAGNSKTLTDASGAYELTLLTLPSNAGLRFTWPGPQYKPTVLPLTPQQLATGDAGDVSLERVRHVSADHPISFSLTNDDARLGQFPLSEYLCAPCVPIVIDDVPAAGLTIHVEWDGSIPLGTFLEGTDADDFSVKAGTTVPVEYNNDVEIQIPAAWSALSVTQPLLKIGFLIGGPAPNVVAAIPVRVTVIPLSREH